MDSLEEAKRIYSTLSEGGTIEMELQKTFWAAYFASFMDQIGNGWMINYDLKPGEEWSLKAEVWNQKFLQS